MTRDMGFLCPEPAHCQPDQSKIHSHCGWIFVVVGRSDGVRTRLRQNVSMTGCTITDFFDLADQLDDVSRVDKGRYWQFSVNRHTFGYLWEPTRTVGLKQTIPEQMALVTERPEVFEVQYTAYGFGWVVVHLEGVERDELAELAFEAWRLTAPTDVIERQGESLPR